MSAAEKQAVFLSYASQDAAVVLRIAEALRAAGVEVWFDKNELVGGDVWDAKIRGQIGSCALFVPVISAATQARHEGYFRLEWKLAAQRTHMMSGAKAFLLPVVIDDTRDVEAHVPVEFREVQWTRLPGGETPEKFCARVQTLLNGGGRDAFPRRPTSETDPRHGRSGETSLPPKSARSPWAVMTIVGAAAALIVLAWWQPWRETVRTPPLASAPTAAQPPSDLSAGSSAKASATEEGSARADKSVVVLPLENLSPDPENAFFTDGMHAEIISTLQRTTDLQVIGRDSALAFKRGTTTVADFARRVGAVNVLSGSVRRAGTKARILLELRRATDDALLWTSPDTERELTDIWTVQSEVAEQLARALKARESVGANAHARLLTRNPRAFDLFLKGDQQFFAGAFDQSIPLYTGAFELDTNYVVPAYMLAHAHCNLLYYESEPATRLRYAADARRWIEVVARLDPNGFGAIAESHYASNADEDNLRALELAERGMRALPNENAAPTFHAVALEGLGRLPEALVSYRRATLLDPLLMFSLHNEARVLGLLRRESEALAMLERMKGILGANTTFDGTALQYFRLRGTLPDAIEAIPLPRERAFWLQRARRYAEAERAAAEAANQAGTNDAVRFELLTVRHDSLLRLKRRAEADAVARELLELARKLQSTSEVGPPRKAGRLAVAAARAGQTDEAIAAARRFVEDAAPGRQQAVRWRREVAFAELYAFLNRPRECVDFLTKLLRVPSGLTVPMLKVDPAWDNVREDAAFQALLADPKNSAPL